MKKNGTYAIPTYAVCAIEYGDYSGVDVMDEKNIKEFLEIEFPKGYVVDWHCNEPKGEPYFCTYPAFGLACDVIDADFYEP